MAENKYPFQFKQCISITKPTGLKAGTLRELREAISKVSDDAIFHHIYQYFLKGHLQEYTNDFAQWAAESIEEHILSEQLSNLDPYTFSSISDLRDELLKRIDSHLELFPEPRPALEGYEFFFSESTTIVFPTGIRAKNLAEFLVALMHIDPSSVYFHYYEARIRLKRSTDDFSSWIEEVIEKPELAETIRRIDPFMHSLEGIKSHIVEYVEDEVRMDMEAVQ